MAELERCPFCGGSFRIQVRDDEGNFHDDDYKNDPWSGLSFSIMHELDVDAIGECPIATQRDDERALGSFLYDTEENTVAAINRRAERTCKRVLWDDCKQSLKDALGGEVWCCSECGGHLPNVTGHCPGCGARIQKEGNDE